MHLRWSQRLRHVVLPGALPQSWSACGRASASRGSRSSSRRRQRRQRPRLPDQRAREFPQTDVIVVGLPLQPARPDHGRIVRPLERKALAWRAVSAPLAEPPTPRVRGGGARTTGVRPEQVLEAVDLDDPPGEFVALLGRTGSGKTTMLRSLAGLDKAPPGDIETTAAPPSSSRSRACCPGARCARTWPRAAQQRGRKDRAGASRRRSTRSASTTSRRLAAGALRRPAPARLAGPRPGEQPRPAAARRAVLRARRADPHREHQLVSDLWRKHDRRLLVTHDVEEAIVLADRVLVLDQGRIAQEVAHPAPP